MSATHNPTETANKAAGAARDNVRIATETSQDAARTALNTVSAGVRRFTDQMTEIFSVSGERGEELTRQSSQNIEAVTQASTVLARGFQDLSREWISFVQDQLQKNIDAFGALTRCRSVPDLMAVQSGLVRENLQQSLDSTRRLAEVSARMVDEATQTMKTRTKGETRRAAA